MNGLRPAVLALVASLGASPLLASAVQDGHVMLKARLAGEGATAKAIAASPIPGLFEVVLEDNTVMYATPDGSYFVVGDIIDPVNKKAVTRERQKQVGAASFQNLPHHLALKSGTVGAKTKVFIVADPNCPYCHRTYQKLKATPNIEINTLLVAVLGPESQKKVMSILCASNPLAAYEADVNGAAPQEASCAAGERAMRSAFDWLKKNPIQQTPMSFFNDGAKESGELTMEQIRSHM